MSDMSSVEQKAKSHKIVCSARSEIEITEVTGVVAFDEEEIVLETEAGKMRVEGEGLRITVLSLETGAVSAVGRIDGISYLNESKEKRSGLFARRG